MAEAHVPNMHFDKGVSARKVEALLQRAQHQTGMSFPLKRMHVKHQSPLVVYLSSPTSRLV